jgi:glycosyltransferase involved in cell wall biosynthesis
VIATYVIDSSAPNRLLAELVAAAGPNGVTLHAVFLDDGRGGAADVVRAAGGRVVALDAAGARRLPVAALRLRRALRDLGSDVVHSNLIWPSVLVEVVRRTMRPRPASVLARHHNRNHHLRDRPLHVRLDRWAARRADTVLAVSPAVKETLVGPEAVPGDRVTVVGNGLDWGRVRASPEGRERWRARFEGRPLLVAAGRLDFQKDYPTLLTAVARVARTRRDVVLAVAHQNADERRVAVLQSLARAQGIERNVVLLGMVEDVHDLMAAADVFVQASVDESFGQALLEAMALGTPVVATTPGGAADVMEGLYPAVPIGDDRALAAGIELVLGDVQSARRHAESVAAEARARWDASAMVAGTFALYRSAASTPS